MLSENKRLYQHRITLLEIILLFFSMAILAGGAIRIYYSALARSYETEVIKAMSIVKIAQDSYYSEHNRFAGINELHPVTADIGLDLSEDSFAGLRYINCNDLFSSTNYPASDELLILWFGGDKEVYGFKSRSMAMDHQGRIYRSEDDPYGDWLPKFPHLQE